MIELPNRWTTLLITLLATVAVLGLLFGGVSLPDPIATHWGIDGRPDDSLPKLGLAVGATLPLLALGIASVLATKPRNRVLTLAFGGGLSAMSVCVAWSIRVLNQGASHWTEARNFELSHAALVVLALLLPLGAFFRRYRDVLKDDTNALSAPKLSLKPQERAVWLSSARNNWVKLLAVPALALPWVVDTPPNLSWLVVVGSVGLLILADAFSYLRVRVDRRGVHITYGHLGLIRQHVDLSDVGHAETLDVQPLKHGGWGYRGSLILFRRAAIVIRGGSALRIALSNGRHLTITIDHPSDGVALLNGLAAQ